MIKIVIPVSQSDFHRLDTFIDNFLHFGGAPSSEVILCPTFSVKSPALDAAKRLEGHCKGVSVQALDREPKGGNSGPDDPRASNEHFMWLTYRLDSLQNRAPWLWMELDTTIVKPNWDKAIDTAYIVDCGGRGFMGHIVPTRKYPNPKDRSQVIVDKLDPHMRGVCVYPHDFTKVVQGQQRTLNDGPWDIHLRRYMRRAGWHQSGLIQDMWRTVNYRMEGERILCDNDPDNTRHGDCSGYVSDDAVIVHGCKDGSLARLMASFPAVASTEPAATRSAPANSLSTENAQPAKPRTPVIPGPFAPISERGGRAPSSGNDASAARELARATARKEQIMEHNSDVISKIRPLLASKKYRVADLSRDTGIPVSEFNTLSKIPTSGLILKGPARWVTLVE